MPKAKLGKGNLMHLYSTSINVLLVLVLLSDVQIVALYQLVAIFKVVLTMVFILCPELQVFTSKQY